MDISPSPSPEIPPAEILSPVFLFGMSPVPEYVETKHPNEMSFFDAMREIQNGRRVTRREWNTNNTFGLLRADTLHICLEGAYHKWIITSGDIAGIDWVVLPEQNG